jgi:hypothetical protein
LSIAFAESRLPPRIKSGAGVFWRDDPAKGKAVRVQKTRLCKSILANMKKPGPAPGFFFAARLFRGAKAVSLNIESSWPGLSRPSRLDGHHAIPYRDARHKAGHDD